MANIGRIVRKVRRAILRDEPGYYDMFENRGERYFAQLYLHAIRQTLQAEGRRPPLTILDAGCQAGRLAVPLAQDGHQVTGVDTSDLALRRAARHARDAGVALRAVRADLARWLPAQPPGMYDVVLCAEMLYLRDNYRALLDGLIRMLSPGGVGFISHRPAGYYLADAQRRHDAAAERLIRSMREGVLWGSYYNWQDRDDLVALYRPLPVDLLSITAIGPISWAGVDLNALDDDGLAALQAADLKAAEASAELGRYLLVTVKKR